MTSVDIFIASYKRPKYLKQTLESLKIQCVPSEVTIKIIVVDNDSKLSAQSTVEVFSADTTLDVTYLSQPIQNIALARNTALEFSRSDYVFLIDDDEIARPDWVSNHLAAHIKFNADIVSGPVEPIHTKNTPKWIINGRYLTRRARSEGEQLKTAGSGNISMTRSLLARENIVFSERYGLTGGSDTELFSRLPPLGVKIINSNTVALTENTPKSRETVRWIVMRAFRVGQIRGRLSNDNILRSIKTPPKYISICATVSYFILFLALLVLGRQYFVSPLRTAVKHIGILTSNLSYQYREYSNNSPEKQPLQ
jgi:succinoglycan biosynthesis protein ExoM